MDCMDWQDYHQRLTFQYLISSVNCETQQNEIIQLSIIQNKNTVKLLQVPQHLSWSFTNLHVQYGWKPPLFSNESFRKLNASEATSSASALFVTDNIADCWESCVCFSQNRQNTDNLAMTSKWYVISQELTYCNSFFSKLIFTIPNEGNLNTCIRKSLPVRVTSFS